MMKLRRLAIFLSVIGLYGIILKSFAYFQVTVQNFGDQRGLFSGVRRRLYLPENRLHGPPNVFGLDEPVYLDFDYITHKPKESETLKHVNLPTLSMFDTNAQIDRTEGRGNHKKQELSDNVLFRRAEEKTIVEKEDTLIDLSARTLEAKLQASAKLPINTDQKREQRHKCFLLHRGNFDNILQHAARNNCSFLTNAELLARTGNQMFQIAAVIGLAQRYDLIPIINDVPPIRDIFELPNVSKYKVSRTRMMLVEQCCSYKNQVERIESLHNWTISGYFQSFKYFTEAEADIIEVFKVSDNGSSDMDLFLNLIKVDGIQTVGIHIRRGDIIDTEAAETGYPIIDLGYITKAMEYYNELFNHQLQFIAISDDIKWCKENIKSENNTVHFSPFSDTARDLVLMTRCDHMIITSGSFGWWGGWLCKGHVVYYKGFPVPGSKLDKEFTLADYYPKKWIGLG